MSEMDEVFGCTVCGADECHEELVDEIFHIGNQYVLVDRIPAAVCNRCGDLTFSADTVEQVRLLVHGETEPVKSIPLNVFEFRNASEATPPAHRPQTPAG